jgi:hypothetical protein
VRTRWGEEKRGSLCVWVMNEAGHFFAYGRNIFLIIRRSQQKVLYNFCKSEISLSAAAAAAAGQSCFVCFFSQQLRRRLKLGQIWLPTQIMEAKDLELLESFQ